MDDIAAAEQPPSEGAAFLVCALPPFVPWVP